MNSSTFWGVDQPFSALSHFVGAIVFLYLSVPLLVGARGNAARVTSLAIFAFTSVLLLSISGAFHIFALSNHGAREVLQKLDHGAIFLLIAGSVTPVHVILFKGLLRWAGLSVIWIAAITGLVLKTIFFHTMSEALGSILYLSLGWCGIVSVAFLWSQYGVKFIAPIVYGGVAYTVGAVIDLVRFPVFLPGIIGSHELFHIAVLAGLAFHWQFMFRIRKFAIPVPITGPSLVQPNFAEQPNFAD